MLTDSANLLMMNHVGDSLAGRAYYVRLQPLTRREQQGLGATGSWTRFFETPVEDWLDLARASSSPPEDWHDMVRRGGFPAAAVEIQDPDERSLWFDGYIATYLERDLRDLKAVSSLPSFQALMQAAALRIGNLLNHAELGREIKTPATTRHRVPRLPTGAPPPAPKLIS